MRWRYRLGYDSGAGRIPPIIFETPRFIWFSDGFCVFSGSGKQAADPAGLGPMFDGSLTTIRGHE